MFDLLLKGAHLEDPINDVSGIRDIAFAEGKVAAVQEDVTPTAARTVMYFDGALAVPGIIDLHVHVCGDFGNPSGFGMLARAGICTALNMAGPTTDLLEHMHQACGLNIATLEDATPGRRLDSDDPSAAEAALFVDRAMSEGAIGIKLLGGHYPLTPEGSERIVRAARKRGGYAAWHAGTTEHGSNIEGMREICELAGDQFVHVAHINSYCRGQIRHELDEIMEAQRLLEAYPSLVSESYIAAANGTSFLLGHDGRLVSRNTGIILNKLGYEDSERGVGQAILDGVAFVFVQYGDETVRITGREAHRIWSDAGTNTGGSFDVNPPVARTALALARRKDGTFLVDCLATDGGSIPRNVLVSHGLGFVAAGVLSLADYVRKTSWNASRCLGLVDKGHLGVGADADISVLDFDRRRAVATIVGGRVCMVDGYVCGSGGTVITTEQGLEHVASRGLPHQCVDLSAGHLPFGGER